MGDNIDDEMVSELGIDPALDVDSDQRAKLLRRWHQGESRYGDEPDVKGDLEDLE
jgi:hypothetical protein